MLLHPRRHAGRRDGWCFLAGSGHADAGESAPDALIRESREELGVTVRRENIRFAHLSHCAEATGENPYYNLYFIVTRWEETPRIMEPEKSAALRFFDAAHLPENTIPLRRRDISAQVAALPPRMTLPPARTGYTEPARPPTRRGRFPLCGQDIPFRLRGNFYTEY